MTGMMTEGRRGRVRGKRECWGEGALMDPKRRLDWCLYVYITSQPQTQPVRTDRVQTERLYQSVTRQPLGKHCLPARRDSPLSGLHFSTKGTGREQFPHSQSLPHWARNWTDTGGSNTVQKRRNYHKYAFTEMNISSSHHWEKGTMSAYLTQVDCSWGGVTLHHSVWSRDS